MEIEQWLDNNKFSIDIWKGKYQRNNENFEEWLNRISNNNEKIKDMVRNKRFIFGGRILANRGMEKEGKHLTFSNCYVMTPPEDNLESIFETASRLARTYSYSGGCGIDISNLRPKDALVNNAAVKSTGAVSFMDMYSKVTETIGQNGRRAALMISISCDHPDLEDFIEIKKDLTKVNFANVSVRFTDKFLNSVLNDEDYELHFTYKSSLGEKELRKNIKARKVFEKFVAANWSSAEPGALFWDKIKGWNLLTNTKTFSYAGTNPCLSGETLIHTNEGLKKIKDIAGFKELEVYTMSMNNLDGEPVELVKKVALNIRKTKENAKVIKVVTDCNELVCTPDHLIYRLASINSWMEASKLKRGDKICAIGKRGFQIVKEIIELENKEDVYDMEVPETHNFIANGIVVHNCAEEPLPAGGSCLLGSINLSAYVVNGEFDIDLYKEDIGNAVRALNEVLEEGLPLHPLKEQRDSVGKWKQIGLGIFGLADMLILKGIKYGSRESIEFCDKLGHILINEACRASALIAKEKGSYEEFNPQEVLNTDFAKYNLDDDVVDLVYNYGLRNSQLLTTAPTGSISNMLHISGGIEPIYDYVYTRTTKSLHEEGDVDYNIYTPIVKNYMEKNGLKNENELPFFFTNALKLDYKERLNMQSVWQSHIDGAISSTLNIPNETTKEQVFDIYIEAWRKGLKGVTIFRDGCDRIPILNNKKLERGVLVKDNNIVGLKRTLKTGCGNLHCSAFFNKETGAFVELFLGKGAKGGCLSTLNGLARMISLSARAGVKLDDIVGQLKSANACPSYAIRSAVNKDTSLGSCCPSAIGNALIDMSEEMKTMLKNGKNNINKKETEFKNIGCKIVVCENCGKPIKHKGGCIECENCGWSKCD